MQRRKTAIAFALLAAGLYAVHVPLSKLLLCHLSPTMPAGALYLGAGLVLMLIATAVMIADTLGSRTPKEKEQDE